MSEEPKIDAVLEKEPKTDTILEKEPQNHLLIVLVVINTIFVACLLTKQMNLNNLQDTSIEEDLTNQSSYDYLPHSDLKAREGHLIGDLVFKEMDVNFATPSGPRRFLKFSFILAVDTSVNKPLEEIGNEKPTIIDGIYSLINKITAKEVLKRGGKESFKIKLTQQINKTLKKDKVVKVYFTKFIVK
jgi:flagellar basal body-associated protein FliL